MNVAAAVGIPVSTRGANRSSILALGSLSDHKAVVVECTLGGSHVMASRKKTATKKASRKKKATKKTRRKKASRKKKATKKTRGKKATGKKAARKKAVR